MRQAAHRLLIVEDHPIMRETYRMLFNREPSLEVAADVATAREALDVLPDLRPDLVIVDISLPEMNGLQLVPHLRRMQPDLLILVITGHHEPHYADAAFAAGADGFIRKGNAAAILEAVYSLLNDSRPQP
ncbi:MAG: response regulator transcription factor [Chloroflexi bacterium]|nr:response regulator transcription factor [Chloroflexota bacterium]